MAVSRWREEPAGLESAPDEWDSDEEDSGFLGFVGVPDTPSGRHAPANDRLGRTFSAAGLPAVALGVALLASLVAGVSLLVGIVAVNRTDDSRKASVASAPSPVPPSELQAPPQAVAPVPPPSPTSQIPPAALKPPPAPVFTPAYVNQLLRVERNACDGTPVDLDEPRVLPAAGAADLNYRNCEDGPHLDLDATTRFAAVDVSSAGPEDCEDALRLNPGVGWLAPDQSMTVCVLTSSGAAAAQRVPQRLVRLHVDAIDGEGALMLNLTAWNVSGRGR
jgi:hypothetical protein